MNEDFRNYESEEIERDLLNEIREQKRVANSASHRKSRKKGFKGNMKFPYEMLKGKAKKEYMGNGKVARYFMFEKDINEMKSYQEVLGMSLEDGKEYLSNVKKFYSNAEVIRHWGVNAGRFYYLYEKFGLTKERKPKTNASKNNKTELQVVDIPKTNENIFNDILSEQINKVVISHIENLKREQEQSKDIIENIVTSKYGILNGEKLYNYLLKIADFIERDVEFDVLIKIKEMGIKNEV